MPGQNVAPVREAVKAILRQFLLPPYCGFEGTGWPLQKTVEPLELLAVAARVPGVAKINSVLLGLESGDTQTAVSLSSLQLPRLAGLSVQPGAPQALADLRGGDAPARHDKSRTRTRAADRMSLKADGRKVTQ